MGVIDFCVVYGCFGVYSWDVCGYFFKCTFFVTGPFRGRGVMNGVLKWRSEAWNSGHRKEGPLSIKNDVWLLVGEYSHSIEWLTLCAELDMRARIRPNISIQHTSLF